MKKNEKNFEKKSEFKNKKKSSLKNINFQKKK